MQNKYLTPLEKRNLGSLFGRGVRIWHWIARILVVLLIGIRIFVLIPEYYYYRIGWTATVVGGWLSFLLVPWVIYNLVSKPVSDRTIETERTLASSLPRFIWSKFKVLIIYILLWTGPLFAIGYICDPKLEFTGVLLYSGLRMSQIGQINTIGALMLTIWGYFGIWLFCTSVLFYVGLRKANVFALMACMLFIVVAIFLSLDIIDNNWDPYFIDLSYGYWGIILMSSMIPPAIGWLIIKRSHDRLLNTD